MLVFIMIPKISANRNEHIAEVEPILAFSAAKNRGIVGAIIGKADGSWVAAPLSHSRMIS
jgi:hypothetical protein